MFLTTCFTLRSDHLPVLIDTPCRSSFLNLPYLPELWRTDWCKFQASLEPGLPSSPGLPNEVAISVCVKQLSSAISKALPESTPYFALVMTHGPRYRLVLTKPTEFQDAIRDLKVRKAPGSNVIPNRALTHLPRSLVFPLVRLFNAILRKQCFSPAWK